MADNWRSKLITAGVARSPNRAMLRAVDFKDGDFEKPIVGVANGHSNMNPCNAGIQPLVDRAMRALREAGAMPQVFGTPTVTDGRFSGATWGMVVGHVAPEAFVGGTIALVKEGDSITIDAHKQLIQLNVPDEELARRRAAWKQPKPRFSRGLLAKYTHLVSTASTGAVTDLKLFDDRR